MKMKKILSAGLAVMMVASMGTSVFATELTGDMLADDAKLDIVAGTYDGAEYYSVVGTVDSGAQDASSVVVVDAEATQFKVTVPIALHVAQDANGDKTYEDAMGEDLTGAAKVINECNLGQVRIEKVTVVPTTGYTISDFNADYANMKVNSKTFGFKINGVEVETDGTVIAASATENVIASTVADEADGKTDVERIYADYNFDLSNAETDSLEGAEFPVIASGSVLPIDYEAKLPAFSSAISDVVYGGVVFVINFN